MKKRIHFDAWGRKIDTLNLPAYAMRTDDLEGDAALVGAAIARKNGLICITCRPDGTALSDGQPTHNHYQLTLGRPCRGGGYTPTHEIWISIPVKS